MTFLNELLTKEFLSLYFSKYYLEESIKFETNKTHSNRYNFWFKGSFIQNINKTFQLFESIENILNINFNYNIIKKYFNKSFDFKKLKYFVFGYDLKQSIKDSRLKIWFLVQNYPLITQKIKSELKNDPFFKEILINDEILFGFDFGFDNISKIKIYPVIYNTDIKNESLKKLLSENLDKRSITLVSKSNKVHLFKNNSSEIILNFHFNKDKIFLNNFNITTKKLSFNNSIDRVISIKLDELKKKKIENYNLYSIISDKPNKKFFKCLNCSNLFSCQNIKNKKTDCFEIKKIKTNCSITLNDKITSTKNSIFYTNEDFDNILFSKIYKIKESKISEKINFDLNSYKFLFSNLKGKILEIGFGDFHMTEYFDLQSKNYYGIELNFKNFSKVKKKYPNLKLFNCNFETFSSKEKFNSLIFLGSINHIKDIHTTFKKIKTLLKSGGQIIIAEHLPINIIFDTNINKKNKIYDFHYHNYKLKDIIHLLLIYNFKIEFGKENEIVWIIKATQK